ncbi:hypothetical protein [Corynebacterium propinquum]|uniref:hypothetical protein n=1 Tax=Corynebacterium propinquum TaxID=43769 RepID=UPI000665F958|nr:hypothetical protein [Corynebacterium propinquum]
MIYTEQEWTSHAAKHRQRAEDRLARYRNPGKKHPIYDFLFEYYPVRPTHLRTWHPGFGTVLEGNPPHADWRDYRRSERGVELDLEAFWQRRGCAIDYIGDLLTRTAARPARFDCFGLHEWAMVYRTKNPRHDLPLRLGAEGTNDLVDKHDLRCTHYDAFRFFTPPARPLSITVLGREDQPECDQGGCVHVTMDLYKWAWKLGPLVPGELLHECFDLAIAARELDMEASPYDCRAWGLGVVAIETTAGKNEYVARQRELAARAEPIRHKLINIVDNAQRARLGGYGASLHT